MQRFVPSGQSAGGEARQLHGVGQARAGHTQTETEGREFKGWELLYQDDLTERQLAHRVQTVPGL